MNSEKSSLDLVRSSRLLKSKRENDGELKSINHRVCEKAVYQNYEGFDVELNSYISLQGNYPSLLVNCVDVEKVDSSITVWYEHGEEFDDVMKVVPIAQRKELLKTTCEALELLKSKNKTKLLNSDLVANLKFFEIEFGMWSVKLQPTFANSGNKEKDADKVMHKKKEDKPSPITKIFAQFLNFENRKIDTNTDVEIL